MPATIEEKSDSQRRRNGEDSRCSSRRNNREKTWEKNGERVGVVMSFSFHRPRDVDTWMSVTHFLHHHHPKNTPIFQRNHQKQQAPVIGAGNEDCVWKHGPPLSGAEREVPGSILCYL